MSITTTNRPIKQLWVNIDCDNIILQLLTAYKASVFEDVFFLLLFWPKISECIDDDAEDEVEDNDDQDKEEEEIINHPSDEWKAFLQASLFHQIHIGVKPQRVKGEGENWSRWLAAAFYTKLGDLTKNKRDKKNCEVSKYLSSEV